MTKIHYDGCLAKMSIIDKPFGKIVHTTLNNIINYPINYHISSKDYFKYCTSAHLTNLFTHNKDVDFFYKNTKNKINEIGKNYLLRKLASNEVYYTQFVNYQKECMAYNEPLISQMILNQYLQLKRLGNPNPTTPRLDFIKDEKDAKYCAEYRHRINLLTTMEHEQFCTLDRFGLLTSHPITISKKIENDNWDFLVNTNYIINPLILRVLDKVTDLDYKIKRSQIISAGHILRSAARKPLTEQWVSDILYMPYEKFSKLRLSIQKNISKKFDFRKTFDIMKFTDILLNTPNWNST